MIIQGLQKIPSNSALRERERERDRDKEGGERDGISKQYDK